ncbi:DNA cytosine methyltransferase [Zobellia sp. B3R18]|uniref:DNA cytosine methyltransferase n=1 Tax=Zobellia sp. B3R18 TaxID=2841568 RepID=UPI001C06EFAF|nr:DNA cytosine methyltransferase [Zobellia sp. B3R18]MBU2975568.1 DNA cytosine methyltransferase [Zobellia sp. B3R18]
MEYTDKKSDTKYIETNTVQIPDGKFPVVSLFSGAGGLDIGLEGAGFRTTVCVEFDTDCRETLRHNRPEWLLFETSAKVVSGKITTRIPGDIRDIEVKELLDLANLKKGEASLVVGGAPCQPFSNIGKKLGKEDEKNGDLFLEFVRMVKGVDPKAFIFENVAGITQQKHSEVIDYMVDNFKGLGYGISHTILNAANYGVPQRRERFFLIGIKGVEKPSFPIPTHFKDKNHYQKFMESIGRKPENKFEKWVSVKDAFDKIPKDHVLRNDYALMNISEKVINRMKYINQGENFKVVPQDLLPNCWKNGKHQGNDTFGRLVEGLPSVTIRTAAYNPSKGMYIHPNQNRGLSTTEMATLQSFPYDWEFKVKSRDKVTLVSGGKQIGNAVPPGLAEALGKSILTQLQPTKSKSVEKLDQRFALNSPQTHHQQQLEVS